MKNEGKIMKFNSLKLILALTFSTLILTGCESVGTEDDVVEPVENAATDNAGSGNGKGETFGAPEEPEIGASQLAEQQAQEAAAKEMAALREVRTFYFDFDQSSVKTASRPALAAHAAFLEANPASKILLEGHSDERGTKGYNIALGESRAKSIARFLAVNGVSSSQIEVLSYGEEKPANAAHNEEAWTQNRRVYIEYK